MTLATYFLSPAGRISRQAFWLGLLALMALSLPVMMALEPELATTSSGAFSAPSRMSTIWSLIITWPSAAISIKRFNDRDWPRWVGYVLGGAMALLIIANHFGLLLDPETMGAGEKLVFASLLIFFMWSFIDNGCFRGTTGPNRYGPDPLPATN